jgi:hypothetical protein
MQGTLCTAKATAVATTTTCDTVGMRKREGERDGKGK